MSKSIAVLMTVHDRKKKTLDCLSSLYRCVLPESSEFNVFLVNDGCTDGTEQFVAKQFPQVHIIQGDGNLFWNRGMLLAWKSAVAFADFDYYIWLNDDVILYKSAIADLLICSQEKNDQAIISGSTCSTTNVHEITYGGRIRKAGILKPNGEMQSCDCCNGQLTLIPRYVYQKMGMNDPIFHHGFGDWDYGFRARKKGLQIFTTRTVSGQCDVNGNDSAPAYLNSDHSLLKRFKLLYSPLGKNPIQFFIYNARHNSLQSAILSFFMLHLKVILPNKF